MLQTRYRFYKLVSSAAFSTCTKRMQNTTITFDNEQSTNENSTNQELVADEYTREFLNNRINLTGLQKAILGIGSSVGSLIDPTRHDMIACLGETTGSEALRNILFSMKSTEEGREILADKPRINTRTVDIEKLRNLSENTFGRAYVKFLDDNQVTPDSRMDVRFIDEPELAYVMTRYRESHDLLHTVLGMPTNMLGEVAVKWVEALNTGLPMCYGGAVFGAVRLRPKQRVQYLKKYLPWAIANGKSVKPLLSVYWEKRWEQDYKQLQDELHIIPFNQ